MESTFSSKGSGCGGAQSSTGDQRLVAYVVLQKGHSAITVNGLQDYLMEQLPAYMVPSAIMFLDALPLNSNGKIDCRNLPLPESSRPEYEKQLVAPRNSLEEVVVACSAQSTGYLSRSVFMMTSSRWEAIPCLLHESPRDLRSSLEVDIPLRSFFEAPTVAQLAEIIMRLKEQNTMSKTPTLRKLSRQTYRLPEATHKG